MSPALARLAAKFKTFLSIPLSGSLFLCQGINTSTLSRDSNSLSIPLSGSLFLCLRVLRLMFYPPRIAFNSLIWESISVSNKYFFPTFSITRLSIPLSGSLFLCLSYNCRFSLYSSIILSIPLSGSLFLCHVLVSNRRHRINLAFQFPYLGVYFCVLLMNPHTIVRGINLSIPLSGSLFLCQSSEANS